MDKRILDCEWVILQALWQRSPMSLSEIIVAVQADHPDIAWKYKTHHSYLRVMLDKELIGSESLSLHTALGRRRSPALSVVLWALLAWVSGALGMVLWLGLSQLALTRRLRQTTEPSVQALAVLEDCRRELNIRTPMDLRILHGGANPMERRIRDMFRSSRCDRPTRLVSLACAVLMGFTGILSACQPTPTKPAVVNKNNGKLEEAVHATATPAPPTALAGDASAIPTAQPTPFPAPASLKYDIPGIQDNFVVQVDAPVTVPENGMFPVIKATGDVYSQEMVDKVREALLPGVTLYQPTDVRTKAQIQTLIDCYQEQLQDSIKGNYEQNVKAYKKMLKDLMAEQAKAPTTVEMKPADTTLHFPEFTRMLLFMYGKEERSENSIHYHWTPETLQKAKDDGYLGLQGLTPYQKNGTQMNFEVTTWQAGKTPRLNFQRLSYSEWQQNYITPMPRYSIDGLTLDAAVAQAQAVLQKIGLPFSLVNATVSGTDAQPEYEIEESHCYSLIFKRNVGTIPQNNFTRPRSMDEMALSDQFREETISLTVDNGGIQGFSWNDPVRVLDVENPNVALLPFDQIKAIFDKQIVATYEARPKDDKEIHSQRLVIYKVSLTAMPVRVQNDPKVFRYVPVWDFCGKLIGKYADDYAKGTSDHYVLNDQNERVVNGQGETLGDTQDMSFLTINAIDGSIIDRNKGY